MQESCIKIGNITVEYGITLTRELLKEGYVLSGFEQIIEEPTLATCNLSENNVTIGVLYFYNLKEKITVDQLADFPIDFALLNHTGKKAKGKPLPPKQALKNRMLWTCLVHAIAVAIYFCIYAVPALFTWVQNTDFRAGGGYAPVGMVLLILPAIVITFLWDGNAMSENSAAKKILLSLWLILNVAISLVYLVFIDNLFTRRFF